MLGVLLVVPVVIAICDADRAFFQHDIRPRRIAEAIVGMVMLTVIVSFVFGSRLGGHVCFP